MSSKKSTTTKPKYLTKRLLQRSAQSAFKEAASDAMELMGYVIKAENGWLIRENADGSKVKIEQLAKVTRPNKIVLK